MSRTMRRLGAIGAWLDELRRNVHA